MIIEARYLLSLHDVWLFFPQPRRYFAPAAFVENNSICAFVPWW
jgi:hypothetical protein